MSSHAAAPEFDYEHFINAFEEVTYWHFAWYSQIMASLLFARSKQIQGHHECKFGQFLDQNLIPPTATAEYAAVRNLHQQMHEAASALMASRGDAQEVEEEIFEEFSELQSLFAAACNALLRVAITSHAEIMAASND